MKKIYIMLSLMAFCHAASAQLTLQTPKAKAATDITANGFTANWGAVKDAEAYCVFVYDKQTVTADGEQVIADEDFDGITSGSLSEPIGGDEEFVDMSAYGYALTYGWGAYANPTFIPSMVSGLVYSPYLDLRGNGGRYKVIITSYCSDKDQLRVESHGKGETVIKYATANVKGGAIGESVDTLEFDNGSKDLFFTVINNTAQEGQFDYTDRIKVVQDLKAGDVINKMVASNEAVMAVDEMTGDSVTSCRFKTPTQYTSSKVLYYDVYASRMDYDTPDGAKPYTYVVSDFSDLVKVDLDNRSSDIVTGIQNITAENAKKEDNAWYNLSGQRVIRPAKGIYIHNGKKIIMK